MSTCDSVMIGAITTRFLHGTFLWYGCRMRNFASTRSPPHSYNTCIFSVECPIICIVRDAYFHSLSDHLLLFAFPFTSCHQSIKCIGENTRIDKVHFFIVPSCCFRIACQYIDGAPFVLSIYCIRILTSIIHLHLFATFI